MSFKKSLSIFFAALGVAFGIFSWMTAGYIVDANEKVLSAFCLDRLHAISDAANNGQTQDLTALFSTEEREKFDYIGMGISSSDNLPQMLVPSGFEVMHLDLLDLCWLYQDGLKMYLFEGKLRVTATHCFK